MAFYDSSKADRERIVERIFQDILLDLKNNQSVNTLTYFNDIDTYIRKSACEAIGKIYFDEEKLRSRILHFLAFFIQNVDFRVRQTVINAAGEIGKKDFGSVEHLFEIGLFDSHHSPRNAVIGSIKKMGEVNPEPVLEWVKKYLHHPDKEIRREICHGIELRGRKFPQDILHLLKELQFDPTSRVRKTLVHVIGQISYKKGCLEIVIQDLKHWENKSLVLDTVDEIIDVHDRYKNFAFFSQDEARGYILRNM